MVGLAMWSDHPLWPDARLVDLYCHPAFWDEGAALLQELELPASHPCSGLLRRRSAAQGRGPERGGLPPRRYLEQAGGRRPQGHQAGSTWRCGRVTVDRKDCESMAELRLLNDEQLRQFIVDGYVVVRPELDAGLHERIHGETETVFEKEGNPGNNLVPRIPAVQQVLDSPEVRGGLTSILGEDYYTQPHRHCHFNPPGSEGQHLHQDGSSRWSHHTRRILLFYYPQDTPEELGPTAVVPGKPLLRHPGRRGLVPRGAPVRPGRDRGHRPLRPLPPGHPEPHRPQPLHDEVPLRAHGGAAVPELEQRGFRLAGRGECAGPEDVRARLGLAPRQDQQRGGAEREGGRGFVGAGWRSCWRGWRTAARPPGCAPPMP